MIKTDGVTQEARWTHPLDEMGQARRRRGQENPFPWFKAAAEKRRGGRKATNPPMPRCQEKPLRNPEGNRTVIRHR